MAEGAEQGCSKTMLDRAHHISEEEEGKEEKGKKRGRESRKAKGKEGR